MRTFLEFFHLGETVPLLLLIGLLEFVGGQMAADGTASPRRLARGLAAAGFLFYAACGLAVWKPATPWGFLSVGLRALLAMGLAHGLAVVALPVLAFAYRWTLGALFTRTSADLHRGARREVERKQEPRKLEAPDPERARQEAERTRAADAARRREEEILSCRLLYGLLAPQIGSRLTPEAFDDLIARYLEKAPDDAIVNRSQRIQEFLKQHLLKVEPPKKFDSFAALARWRDEQLAQRPANLNQDDHDLLTLTINEKYDELMKKLIREM